jgi:sugar phosphate isomerase/epimerase
MKFILSTGSLYNYGLERCFEVASKIGFFGIELIVDYRLDTRDADYLKKLIDRYSLPVLSIHSPFSHKIIGAKNIPDSIEKTVELAESIGAHIIVHHLPNKLNWIYFLLSSPWRRFNYSVPLPTFKLNSYFLWLQKEYEKFQENTSVLLCIENLPATRFLGYCINPAYWNPSNLKNADEILRFNNITMDTTHLGTWGLDPLEMYSRWKVKIRHIHLSNYKSNKMLEHQRPEDGDLQLDKFLIHLSMNKYEGLVTLEFKPDALKKGYEQELLSNSLNYCLGCIKW